MAILENLHGFGPYDGAVEALNNHFQLDKLDSLINSESLLFQLVQVVLADMEVRYGSSNPSDVGFYQWGTAKVLLDLPLDLGVFP